MPVAGAETNSVPCLNGLRMLFWIRHKQFADADTHSAQRRNGDSNDNKDGGKLIEHMRKSIIFLLGLIAVAVLSGCRGDETVTENTDYGNAGIYDMDGNRIISYETMVKKYHVDITKDYEEDNNFDRVLDQMGIDEDITLILPDVNRIGDYAFCYAENLAYVNFPETLESIGSYSFYSSGIREISLPSGVTAVKNNAFDSCMSLSSVRLNEGLKAIDTSAFRYTPCLTELTIPETVETIGACAFQAAGIQYMFIPETVNHIEDSSFLGVDTICYSGAAVSVDNFGAANMHQYSDSNMCDICKNTVEYVPYTIKEASFIEQGRCSIPETFERNGICYKVVKIAAGAYENNRDITSLELPDSLVCIESSAFADCAGLKSVKLNDTLEKIGEYTFARCIAIEEIVIPDKISAIYGCFSGCTSLQTITLPKGIGLSVQDFDGCDNLREIYFEGTQEEWNSLCVSAPAPIMEVSIDRLFDGQVAVYFTGGKNG